ncbi:MAG: hypothetical protein V4735_05365 [Pseudomonadota bacterium]
MVEKTPLTRNPLLHTAPGAAYFSVSRGDKPAGNDYILSGGVVNPFSNDPLAGQLASQLRPPPTAAEIAAAKPATPPPPTPAPSRPNSPTGVPSISGIAASLSGQTDNISSLSSKVKSLNTKYQDIDSIYKGDDPAGVRAELDHFRVGIDLCASLQEYGAAPTPSVIRLPDLKKDLQRVANESFDKLEKRLAEAAGTPRLQYDMMRNTMEMAKKLDANGIQYLQDSFARLNTTVEDFTARMQRVLLSIPLAERPVSMGLQLPSLHGQGISMNEAQVAKADIGLLSAPVGMPSPAVTPDTALRIG